jgi:NADPH:quinone reductase-like Zn-dependent oxidoreductase
LVRVTNYQRELAMKAAVVSSFNAPPRYQEFPTPTPKSSDEMLVDVIAAGLHPRVRSQADGSHYTSTTELPLVPGIDGVGRGSDGRLHYFILPDTTMGAMAEKTVIDRRRSVVLPDDTDPVAVAAAMNPAMSSWVALRHRIEFRAGQKVLILGATGNAGELAVQITKWFGATQIIAAGRDTDRLGRLLQLGATNTVDLAGDSSTLAQRLGPVANDVDVVIDYIWGRPTANAMMAVVTHRTDRGKPLAWIEIGSVAGPDAPIPSAALRAARMAIVGSGQGSVSTKAILAELPSLAQAIAAGTFAIDARPVPLHEVERAWGDAARTRQRIVITPQP